MKIKPVAHGINQRNKILIGCLVCAVVVTYLSLSSCSSQDASIETLSLLNSNNNNNIRLEEKSSSVTTSSDKKKDGFDYPDPAFAMNAIPAPEYHLVVSTGCNTYQDWQSYVLFYHAVKSGQVNGKSLSYVTRVVSGCNEDQAKTMNDIHARIIEPIAPGKFFIHHTPDYSRVKPKLVYKFFNKPMGYRHWMINALRYPYNHQKYDNTTFILMDPDQVILRPFTNDFTHETERWGGPFRDKRQVTIGQPFAQEYAFGVEKWRTPVSMPQLVPSIELPSNVKKMTRNDAFAYMVGPPYILKGADMWKIISKWAEIVPHVHEQVSCLLLFLCVLRASKSVKPSVSRFFRLLYFLLLAKNENKLPEHLAEMYAYSIAAAVSSLFYVAKVRTNPSLA